MQSTAAMYPSQYREYFREWQSAQVRHAARILQSDIEGAIESTKTPGVSAESVGVETAIDDNSITVTVTTREGTRA